MRRQERRQAERLMGKQFPKMRRKRKPNPAFMAALAEARGEKLDRFSALEGGRPSMKIMLPASPEPGQLIVPRG